MSEKVKKIQRSAYLRQKKIDISEPFQLGLLFPDVIGSRNDLRHIPNELARSSIFTSRNKSIKRGTLLRQELYHYNEYISVLYTGVELRAEDDELVWMQIVNYGKEVPLGQPFEFSLKNLVSDVGWHKNGRYYAKARECISRLKANEILLKNSKAYGESGALSLIQNYQAVNDSENEPVRYKVCIDPNLIVLFAGSTFTSHAWLIYRKLSPVARRLADYIESHKNPYPLPLEKFRQMCGSVDSTQRSWRQTVKKACAEVCEAQIAQSAFLSEKDLICCHQAVGREMQIERSGAR